MDNSSYKKIILPLVSVKNAKEGIRLNLRKKPSLNLGHAVLGMGTEFGEIRKALSGFLLGHQLTDEMRSELQEELGDFVFYLTLGAREAKVKMPSATKKLVPKHTLTELIMMVDGLVTDNLSQYKRQYYGLPSNTEAISKNIEAMIPLVIQMSWGFLHKPLADVQQGNAEKLMLRYPNGSFDVNSIHAKEAKQADSGTKTAQTA